MPALPLGEQAYKRDYANEPEIQMFNRFFETNPTNTTDQKALLARPGSSVLINTGGTGLNRGCFSTADLFKGDLFFVMGASMYRLRADGTLIPIGGTVYGTGKASFAFNIGPSYARLFVADGTLLQYYDGGSKGIGVLTASAAITNQIIQVGLTYYTWAATVTGTATGTLALPWICKLGVDTPTSLQNMANMINFVGVRGIDFSVNLGGQSSNVVATNAATTLTVTSKSDLASANLLATTATGTGLAWGATTVVGAGTHVLKGVAMPDGKGAQAVCPLSSYVLVAIANSGRFYWLQPGATIINGLDFASAESQPDNIIDMISTGDTAWILSGNSTEVWYATGNIANPFAPTQGRAYSRGIIPGTSVRIKDQVVAVGSDNIVYAIGRGVQRISHHGIEERIRTQIKRESGQ